MAQFPGLMLWTGEWVADTAHLTRLERGTYHDLLVLMWRTPGCRVPNDDQWLAKHMRMTAEEVVAELRPIIKEFCQNDGNWLFQKRLQIEFVRAFKRSHKQSVRAKSRWERTPALNKQHETDPPPVSAKSQRERDKSLSRGNAAHAMHLSKNSKRESFCSRASEDEEPEAVAEKKANKVSAELIQLVQAKRSHSEE